MINLVVLFKKNMLEIQKSNKDIAPRMGGKKRLHSALSSSLFKYADVANIQEAIMQEESIKRCILLGLFFV